jgi:hypothetical protein
MARREKADRLKIDLLFYPSPVKGRWVAHCLNIDIVGTGADPREAFEELLGSLEVQFEAWAELGAKAAPPSRAPRELWNKFKSAKPLPDIAVELGDWAKRYHRRRGSKFPDVPKACTAAILLEDQPALA